MSKATQTPDEYIAEKSDPVQFVLQDLRRLVQQSLPSATCGMKWGVPVFCNSHGIEVVYLYGGKDHANLGFVRGAELSDPDRLLKGPGISGRHVKIFPKKPVPEKALKALVCQCGRLS